MPPILPVPAPVPPLTLKEGAQIGRPRPAGFVLLWALQQVAINEGLPLVITSGDEPRGRSPLDPHMTGEAYDVSVSGLDEVVIWGLWKALVSRLDQARFTVLFEVPRAQAPTITYQPLRDVMLLNDTATAVHLHTQRKKGTSYP